jgi:hypothetical protein
VDDHAAPIQLPIAMPLAADRALDELTIAIALVARGGAERVHVTGLAGLDEIAALAVVRAQVAGVRFSLVRDGPDAVSAVVGPRDA